MGPASVCCLRGQDFVAACQPTHRQIGATVMQDRLLSSVDSDAINGMIVTYQVDRLPSVVSMASCPQTTGSASSDSCTQLTTLLYPLCSRGI